jgi:uncharacterized protein YggE
VKLGAVQKIDDTGTVVPQPLQYDQNYASSAKAEPIQAGTQQLSVDVTVTFAVSPS